MKLQSIYRFFLVVVLLMLQVWVFNSLVFLRVATPFVYLFGLWIFPVGSAPLLLTWVGALMGMALDFLSGTPGLHLAAATLAGFVRPYLLSELVDREDNNDAYPPSFHLHGKGVLLSLLSWVSIHHVLLFGLDFFSGSSWHYFLLRTFSSILFTSILLLLLQLLFLEKKRD